MSMDRSKGLALVLITAGILISLHQLGSHIHLMGLLFPAAMLGLGYVGIKNGKKIGWFIAGLGGLILTIKLSGLIAIAFAIGLVMYGFHLLKKRNEF
ncbi:hypothetical protein M5X11_30355 [Paenibacillus alginolyticus]|uniref:Uncharacterized protein n=1 Tax=Paenibacillus alginolyticus TaxID=59839 RepID=A0ABT4GL30_9BACL|nr:MULTISPECIES: hypothetical protein [Paenibacillus]MCY9669176.1 hypothetical protein [Paenibacillus alginolyticus]MCY9696914.1 hypothetical protein [Paenibacillus alginolyticus]MEC0145509.1 hypothetical protein [Paenibacillus alginolyticus]NRF95446.1 hypothetical protein [Paenibacillus frigoriresistens]